MLGGSDKMKTALWLAVTLAMSSTAFASVPKLYLVTGSTKTAVTGAGDHVLYNNSNFGGWKVDLAFGASKSPELTPYALNLTVTTIACSKSNGCKDLHVWLSDVGFDEWAFRFQSGYSVTTLTHGKSTYLNSWVGPTDEYFESDGSGGAPTVSGGIPLPKLGPLHTTSGETSNLNYNTADEPYSLTLEAVFLGCAGRNCAGYGSNAQITGSAIPEPGTVTLLGSTLVALSFLLRKRVAARRLP
jgi:hypothetical protein